ncbi:MAG: DUF4214 domain-containing protein [Pannonibacter sp.]
MATTDQITQYFVNILQRSPSPGEMLHFSAMVTTGQMTLLQVRDAIAASPEATTYVDQIIRIYQAAFGRAPDPVGLNGWTNLLREDPTALSKVALGFVNSTEWMNRHGNNSVSDAVLQSLYQNVLGRIPSQAEIDAWKASGQPMTQILIGFSNSAEFQKTSAPRVTEIKQAVADTPLPPAPVETPKTPEPTPVQDQPVTYTLTTGADAIAGGNAADTVNGIADGTINQTFSDVDSIDGGAGNDTFRLVNTTGTMALSTVAVVKNVETLELESIQNAVTADVRNWTGLQTVKLTQSGTKAAIAADTGGNVAALTVTGGTTVTINDHAAAGSDKLSSVSLDGYSSASTIQSDALTTLSLANSNQNVTVTAAAGTRTLDIRLDNMKGGTINDSTATAMSVTTTGSASSGVTVNGSSYTSLTLAGDKTLALSFAGLATTGTITSTNTAGVNISTAFGNGVAFAGGSGADTVRVWATENTVTLGAGDDRLILNVSALGAGGSIDAGAGKDTLVIGADNIISATSGTTFASVVKNFEVLEFAGLTNASGTISLSNLNSGGANAVTEILVTGSITKALTVNADPNGLTRFTTTNTIGNNVNLNGVASGATLEHRSNNSSPTTVKMTDAATNTTDVLNVLITSSGARAIDRVNAQDVETINFLTDNTSATPSAIQHTAKLTADAARTVTVSGDAGLNLSSFIGTAVTLFDASGVTLGDVTWTTGALTTAATIKGGAGKNTLNAAAATASVTIETGAGDDTITGSAKADTINAGAGDDTIRPGLGADTIDVGTGTDTVILTGTNTNGTIFSSITGMNAGDKIQFISGTASFQTAAITAGGAPSYADLLDAATNGAANRVVWFQFGGDTYLVQDRSANTTFTNGTDGVVKLVGLYDLSTATISGTSINLLTLG